MLMFVSCSNVSHKLESGLQRTNRGTNYVSIFPMILFLFWFQEASSKCGLCHSFLKAREDEIIAMNVASWKVPLSRDLEVISEQCQQKNHLLNQAISGNIFLCNIFRNHWYNHLWLSPNIIIIFPILKTIGSVGQFQELGAGRQWRYDLWPLSKSLEVR